MEEPVNISLLDRFIRRDTTAEEEKHLLEWFRAEGSRKEIFAYYRVRWEEAAHRTMSAQQQVEIFHRLKRRIKETQNISNTRKFSLYPWMKYAAVALLCLALGGGIAFSLSNANRRAVKEFIVKADKGQRASLTLPDGTNVWLNSHTELIYSSLYGSEERTVRLNGEAYFEIAPDTENPFIVKTDQMDIEALGTSFNVKAYTRDRDITTTLLTGKVKASTTDGEVVLTPGQYASFDRNQQTLTSGIADNALYACMWRENELAFNSHTLEDIAHILDRMYNVQIEFSSESIKKHRFSGVIKNNSLDNVIEIISLTAPIIYRSTGDTIIISEKPSK